MHIRKPEKENIFSFTFDRAVAAYQYIRRNIDLSSLPFILFTFWRIQFGWLNFWQCRFWPIYQSICHITVLWMLKILPSVYWAVISSYFSKINRLDRHDSCLMEIEKCHTIHFHRRNFGRNERKVSFQINEFGFSPTETRTWILKTRNEEHERDLTTWRIWKVCQFKRERKMKTHKGVWL